MSRVMREKHVMKEMMDDCYELPREQQQIVRVVGCRGNNLHEVEDANAVKFLVSMPNKFRKNVWVKRGDFLLVEPIEEGDKVKAEICRILTAEHVKEYTKADIWPKQFTKKREYEETKGDDGLFRNCNRPRLTQISDNSSEES